MNKFNLPRRNIQKERRQKRTERRKHKARTTAAAPVKVSGLNSLALSVASTHTGYLSGKNRAKLQKRWRRAQKEALQSGLVSMQDIEMMAAEGDEEPGTDDQVLSVPKAMKKAKFSMKKRAKLRSKSGANVSAPVVVSTVDGDDAMMQ